MAYWDFTEYSWAVGNLSDNLTPAFTRSCRFFAVWYVALALWFPSNPHNPLLVQFAILWKLTSKPTHSMAAKGFQLYFWPSFEYASALTMLTGYHAAFALFYLSSLALVAHCCRRVEAFRTKLKDTRAMDEADVRAWRSGFVFRATNWLAGMRAFRRWYFDSWYVGDLIADAFMASVFP